MNIIGDTLVGSNKARFVTWFMILVGAYVFAMAAHRSCVSSFTHDESYSFLYYVDLSYQDLLSNRQAYSNNHILNSIGMKLAMALSGPSEIALRSPNLIGCVIYLVCIVLLLRHVALYVAVPATLLLFTNPFLVELFSLARGYGLATGFLTLALYQLVRAIGTGNIRALAFFHIAALAACYSNFVALTAYLPMVLTFMILGPTQHSERQLLQHVRNKAQVLNLTFLIVVASVLALPVIRSLEQNSYAFGDSDSLWGSTLATWSRSPFSYGHYNENIQVFTGALLVCSFLIAGVVALRMIILQRGDSRSVTRTTFLASTITTLGAVLIVEVQHYLTGTDRLGGRFAMFLFPFLVVSIILLGEVIRGRWPRILHSALFLAVGMGSIFSFVKGFGPANSVEWQYDRHTKDVMMILAQEIKDQPHDKASIHLGVTWLFEPTMNFYRRTWGLDELQVVDRNGLTAHDSYRYVLTYMDDPPFAGYERLMEYPDIESVLFRRVTDPEHP